MTFARKAAGMVARGIGLYRGAIMRSSVNKYGSLKCPRNIPVIVCLLLIGLVVMFTVAPCNAIQWPWTTTHEDLIQQRLNDIWQAILKNDNAVLKNYLMGFAIQSFIAQERRFIETMGITSYDLKVRSIKFGTHKQFAYVDFDRIGATKNGNNVSNRFLKTFKRVGNDWKLLINVRKKKSKQPLD
jgi:hypothetical protein